LLAKLSFDWASAKIARKQAAPAELHRVSVGVLPSMASRAATYMSPLALSTATLASASLFTNPTRCEEQGPSGASHE
jgi:hypothetical protein